VNIFPQSQGFVEKVLYVQVLRKTFPEGQGFDFLLIKCFPRCDLKIVLLSVTAEGQKLAGSEGIQQGAFQLQSHKGPKTSSPEVNVSPSPVGGTGGGGGAAVATSSTANSSPVTAGAMAVVTSLTLTEAETAVHLPAPPSPSSATVAVAGQTINVSVDNSSSGALNMSNDDGQRTVVPSSGNTNGFPSAVLTCRPNSHPFQERTLYGVQEQFKIGRSVARSKPTDNNAIFDCKVLSRNHALIWYKEGKFFLQDTKSSNGTFVNNARLSKGSEESDPREICSGDILQFGVDVQENAKKLTHGCIIATVRLFLPDGKEAKASPTIMTGSCPGGVGQMGGGHGMTAPAQQDLHQLNLYIQEALVREQMLENKLAMLQRLVGQTNAASDEAWKSLIDEDRLLTRVEILESQLSTYSKAMNEDRLRDETKKLMQEKEDYQETAKATLKKLVDEKLEAVNKQKELEKALSNIEDEYASLKELHDKDVAQNRELAVQVSRLTTELEEEVSKQKHNESASSILNTSSSEALGNQQPLATSTVTNLTTSGPKNSLLSGATVTVSVDNEAATTTSLISASVPASAAKADDEKSIEKPKAEGSGDPSTDGELIVSRVAETIEPASGQSDSSAEQQMPSSEADKENELNMYQERLSEATDQLKDFNLKLKEATDLLVAKDQVVKDLQKQVEAAEQEAQEYWKLLAVADRKTEEQKLQSVGDSVSPSVETANVATQSSVASDQGLGVSVATQSAAAESTDADQQTDQETDGAHSHNGTDSSETDEENEKLRSQNQKLTGEQRNLLEKNQELCQQVEELSSTLEILRQHEKPLPPPPPPGADNDEDEHQAGAKAVEEEEDIYDEAGQNGMHSAGSSPERDTAELERSLSEAESKISELLKIKERYAEIDAERSNLAANLSLRESEISELTLQSRTATACSVLPLALLVFAIIVAYLPSLSSIFGTAEKI